MLFFLRPEAARTYKTLNRNGSIKPHLNNKTSIDTHRNHPQECHRCSRAPLFLLNQFWVVKLKLQIFECRNRFETKVEEKYEFVGFFSVKRGWRWKVVTVLTKKSSGSLWWQKYWMKKLKKSDWKSRFEEFLSEIGLTFNYWGGWNVRSSNNFCQRIWF